MKKNVLKKYIDNLEKIIKKQKSIEEN